MSDAFIRYQECVCVCVCVCVYKKLFLIDRLVFDTPDENDGDNVLSEPSIFLPLFFSSSMPCLWQSGYCMRITFLNPDAANKS